MKALRLYARLGLLEPVRVDESNGYRWYRASQLATARLIAMLRRLDMPLNQVAEVVAAAGPDVEEVERPRQPDLYGGEPIAGTAPRARRRAADLVADYWDSVERRIASQRLLAAHLQIRFAGEEGSFLDMFDIQQRDVPEQLVITEQRHILQPELSGWLSDAIGRLHGVAAQRFGGVAAPVFVVYHGEVNQDSDGPVEVCVPIALDRESSANGVPMRHEAAHREAFTRITRAQFDFPQILSAYDAVTQWIAANTLNVAGSPREVYFTDFHAAAPTDEVADIAFPIS
ncbi:MAG: MerR family transcriptional regulator [Chloroflexi bacterium]|nr:MerR family transcriptional regulator [Chloroflexota bacterium]